MPGRRSELQNRFFGRISLVSSRVCESRSQEPAGVADLEFDKVGTSYDEAVAQRFVERDVAVASEPFEVGDVSFHSALRFHTAGPNRTTQPRRALATTYFADGARVVESPTLISGTWRKFLGRRD